MAADIRKYKKLKPRNIGNGGNVVDRIRQDKYSSDPYLLRVWRKEVRRRGRDNSKGRTVLILKAAKDDVIGAAYRGLDDDRGITSIKGLFQYGSLMGGKKMKVRALALFHFSVLWDDLKKSRFYRKAKGKKKGIYKRFLYYVCLGMAYIGHDSFITGGENITEEEEHNMSKAEIASMDSMYSQSALDKATLYVSVLSVVGSGNTQGDAYHGANQKFPDRFGKQFIRTCQRLVHRDLDPKDVRPSLLNMINDTLDLMKPQSKKVLEDIKTRYPTSKLSDDLQQILARQTAFTGRLTWARDCSAALLCAGEVFAPVDKDVSKALFVSSVMVMVPHIYDPNRAGTVKKASYLPDPISNQNMSPEGHSARVYCEKTFGKTAMSKTANFKEDVGTLTPKYATIVSSAATEGPKSKARYDKASRDKDGKGIVESLAYRYPVAFLGPLFFAAAFVYGAIGDGDVDDSLKGMAVAIMRRTAAGLRGSPWVMETKSRRYNVAKLMGKVPEIRRDSVSNVSLFKSSTRRENFSLEMTLRILLSKLENGTTLASPKVIKKFIKKHC